MSDEDYAPYLQDVKVRIIYGQTYRLVQQARAALSRQERPRWKLRFCGHPKWFVTVGKGGR